MLACSICSHTYPTVVEQRSAPSSSDPPLALHCCHSSSGTQNFPPQLIWKEQTGFLGPVCHLLCHSVTDSVRLPRIFRNYCMHRTSVPWQFGTNTPTVTALIGSSSKNPGSYTSHNSTFVRPSLPAWYPCLLNSMTPVCNAGFLLKMCNLQIQTEISQIWQNCRATEGSSLLFSQAALYTP